jgi:asparagine synthase (glutamine-hydrolysing)
MCGIVAMFSMQDAVDPNVLAGATRRLSHRGPDGQRHWISPDGRIGLGHARLGIIDLENGSQPIANEDGRLQIVVNGEFYQFEEIRRDLEAKGHRFRTLSDSEIALHLYEEIGTESVHHLRGEFAFVLWDEENDLLFAARDRFGIKPLFYSFYRDTLHLASEAKALFAAGVATGWDRESYFQQLFLYHDQDRTLFNGVYQLPPAHYLVATKGRIRVTRYWDLNYPRSDQRRDQTIRERSEGEYVEKLRCALDEAVRIRLRADVPVGSFLSGGIDSSTVFGLAARHSPQPLNAYTITFSEGAYDEESVASETAMRAGAVLHPLLVSEDDIAAHVADAVEHAETLGINGHGVGRYLLCRHIQRAGQKVVLTGEGSDEIFAGYMQARQDLLLHHHKAQHQTPRRKNDTPESEWLSFTERTLGYSPSWLRRLATGRSVFHVLLDDDYAEEHAQRNPHRVFLSQFDINGQLNGREPMIQSMYLWARSILPNYSLFAERLEMAWGIETRLPFLDHKVFELVREMPPSMLVRGAKEKYVLRQAAQPYLTETVYDRPKHPFLAPPSASRRGPVHMLLEDTLRGPSLRATPFFDRGAVIALLDRLPRLNESVQPSVEQALQMILSTCLLQERYHL